VDFFEVFPQFEDVTDPSLAGRALRLIAVFGIARDDSAYYFEMSRERYWRHLPDGTVAIGVSGAQAQVEDASRPLKPLFRHVRDAWNSEPEFFPAAHTYLVEGERYVVLNGGSFAQPTTPHLLVLTPPRLGGGEVPDALVQAVYFLGLRRPPYPLKVPGLVAVKREALGDFLGREGWPLLQLEAQPWAEVLSSEALAPSSYLRPVLALRAVQRLWQEGLFPPGVTSGGGEAQG
jgi:hypothetical protein